LVWLAGLNLEFFVPCLTNFLSNWCFHRILMVQIWDA
jgi:hypothetical protein